MSWVWLGGLSFAFFLLFDVGKARGWRYGHVFFFLGGLLLAFSTLMLLLPAFSASRPPWRTAFGALGLFWLGALLYVLFVALPKSTYADSGRPRLCSTGVYALCRHPGGWCLLLFYWSLALFVGDGAMTAAALVFPALNFLYIWLEDRLLFPAYIEGYDEYRRMTPFLLPNRASIRAFCRRRTE